MDTITREGLGRLHLSRLEVRFASILAEMVSSKKLIIRDFLGEEESLWIEKVRDVERMREISNPSKELCQLKVALGPLYIHEEGAEIGGGQATETGVTGIWNRVVENLILVDSMCHNKLFYPIKFYHLNEFLHGRANI